MKAPERRLWVKGRPARRASESIIAAARAEAKEMIEAEGKTDDGSMYVFHCLRPILRAFYEVFHQPGLKGIAIPPLQLTQQREANLTILKYLKTLPMSVSK